MCGFPPEDSSKSSHFLEKRKAYPHSADVNLELEDCKEPCNQQVTKLEGSPTLSDSSPSSFYLSLLPPCPSPNPMLSRDLQTHRLDCGPDMGDFAPSLQEAFFSLNHPNRLFPNKCPLTSLPKVVLQLSLLYHFHQPTNCTQKPCSRILGSLQWFSHLREEFTEESHQKCPFLFEKE